MIPRRHLIIHTSDRTASVPRNDGCAAEQPGRPTVEEMRAQYEAAGALVRHRNRPRRQPQLTAGEKARIVELRQTMTLIEIAKEYNRHPSTIHEVCRDVPVDFRGKRKSKRRGPPLDPYALDNIGPAVRVRTGAA
jgi:hypothetical protein